VKAEIIAIGSELLTPYRQDTNSLFLTERLNQLGAEVRFKTVVGDSRADLISVARAHSPYRPLFYDLGDESGIANLAAFWDFDFSDQSLAEMRVWLKDPDAIKPGSLMPAMQLNDTELDALVGYMQSLR